jgi:acetoin utilization deacetylase AcuC-like enzyme
MKVFYSPDYIAAAQSFDTTRKAGWIAESLATNAIAGVEIVAPSPLTFEEIAAVHDAAYVKSVRRGEPKHLAESQGFTWDPGIWKAVTASNGGAVAAACAALTDGVSGSLSSGMHHAQHARGASFCTFNGLVLAAKRILAEGARSILILDLDAHCGGGTHSLIENDDRIRQIDVSVNVVDAYWQNGVNALDIVRDADNYLTTIEQRLAEPGSYDVCIYNSGMDADERCEVGGCTGINADVLRQREEMVFGWAKKRGIPIAFVLAGGYAGALLTEDELVNLHRQTLASAQSISSGSP